MRRDENGKECPSTLGEYRDLCYAIVPDSEAVAFLDRKIATDPLGRLASVIAPDSQMRHVLMPMLLERATSIYCPECHRISFNPNDILNYYCGNCRKFLKDPR